MKSQLNFYYSQQDKPEPVIGTMKPTSLPKPWKWEDHTRSAPPVTCMLTFVLHKQMKNILISEPVVVFQFFKDIFWNLNMTINSEHIFHVFSQTKVHTDITKYKLKKDNSCITQYKHRVLLQAEFSLVDYMRWTHNV